MDAETKKNEDFDLSHEDNTKNDETNEDEGEYDEMNRNEQINKGHELGAGEPEPIKFRKKLKECQCKNDNIRSPQKDELKEGDESQDDATSEEPMVENEKPASTLYQFALFLAIFAVLVVVNHGIIQVIFYFFKPEDVSEYDRVEPSEYEEENEFTEFDPLMEH